MTFSNYIPDTNPFNLAGPPDYFLRKLLEFDPSLVLVASRQGFFYRLAQRRPLKLAENVVNDILKEQSDTRMLAQYGLVPITTVVATARWDNPMIFVELEKRAPWRMGGAQKVIDMIEGAEREELLKKRIAEDERLGYVAKDSWRFYQKLIGTRSHLWSPTVKKSDGPYHEPSSGSASSALIIPGANSYRPETQATWVEPRKRR